MDSIADSTNQNGFDRLAANQIGFGSFDWVWLGSPLASYIGLSDWAALLESCFVNVFQFDWDWLGLNVVATSFMHGPFWFGLLSSSTSFKPHRTQLNGV